MPDLPAGVGWRPVRFIPSIEVALGGRPNRASQSFIADALDAVASRSGLEYPLWRSCCFGAGPTPSYGTGAGMG